MQPSESPDFQGVLTDSWQRCNAWGLSHDHQPAPATTADTDTSMHEQLLTAAEAEVVPYYRNVLSSSRSLIVLADSQARVLRSWGDERVPETRLRPWFRKGACWQERLCGTNAIGTAIATEAPVQVQREQHFLKWCRGLIGSAAPVFNADKKLAGVLSVFSDAYLPQAHTLGVVRLLALSLENRLIIRQFEAGHFQLTLNTTEDNFDSPWSGILMCNPDGLIVASNQRADQLLGRTTLNRKLDELFTTGPEQILGYPERSPMQLRTLGKVRLSAQLKRPAIDLEPALADEEISASGLPRLEHGDERVKRCFEQGLKVLERGLPLLITGETGVGKEVLVKSLHGHSRRRQQPLVAVNCAAIPPELVESELFGYEPGAFTGAAPRGSQGFIRKAHKGILFLDEIGEMPVQAQSRLLRVLQEREVTPVGSSQTVPVDILLITATNQSLAHRVEAGQFRADLYYRINGLALELPALRERNDRLELIRSIYRRYREPGQAMELSPPLLTALDRHPWPGNIRQLVNVLRAAIAIADGANLQPWHLPAGFLEGLEAQTATEPQIQGAAPEPQPVTAQTTGDVRPEPMTATLRVYHQCMGNISRAARELGISRNTLYKRLRVLGVR